MNLNITTEDIIELLADVLIQPSMANKIGQLKNLFKKKKINVIVNKKNLTPQEKSQILRNSLNAIKEKHENDLNRFKKAKQNIHRNSVKQFISSLKPKRGVANKNVRMVKLYLLHERMKQNKNSGLPLTKNYMMPTIPCEKKVINKIKSFDPDTVRQEIVSHPDLLEQYLLYRKNLGLNAK